MRARLAITAVIALLILGGLVALRLLMSENAAPSRAAVDSESLARESGNRELQTRAHMPANKSLNQLENPVFQPKVVMERSKSGLGEGVAISPNGRLLLYVGTGKENGLWIRDLESGNDRLILDEAEPGLDVFYNPTFSSDGAHVLFAASGGTWHYPSLLYTLAVDGSGLRRLTNPSEMPEEASSGGGPDYAQYFDSALFSPDSTRILVQGYDAASRSDEVMVLNSDGSDLKVLARGQPLFWSTDGRAVYFSFNDQLFSLQLSSGSSTEVQPLNGATILGKNPQTDTLVLMRSNSVDLMTIENGVVLEESTTSIPAQQSFGQPTAINNQETLMSLQSIQWSNTGRIVLVYANDSDERVELLEAPERQ